MARTKPVVNPPTIEFIGSSLCLIAIIPQHEMEKIKPHMAKLPPSTGALLLNKIKPPFNLSFLTE
jgi:hypothetical protein